MFQAELGVAEFTLFSKKEKRICGVTKNSHSLWEEVI